MRRIGYSSFAVWAAVIGFTAVLAWQRHDRAVPIDKDTVPGSSSLRQSMHIRLVEGPGVATNGGSAGEAKYLGSSACQGCHAEQHQGYLETLHSKSFRDLNGDKGQKHAEWVGSFVSRDKTYMYHAQINAQGLVHQEWGQLEAGPPLLIAEKSIGFAIGSGDHATSFLVRDGPFWLQSPITKYRESIGYSPGFQFHPNLSFSRKVTASCAFCHVGQIVRDEPLHPYRFEVVEQSIGCERCHGPGERHVQARQKQTGKVEDEFIVHPTKLDRDLAEAICQQCHLQGDAKVNPLGKDDWDFRPGQPLSRSRVDFRVHSKDRSMRLVGHVEQMHEAKCYQEDQTFTCTTCHDPHGRPAATDRAQFYRSKCFQCHDTADCEESAVNRNRKQDDCIVCHMPRASVLKQSHLALHQHRVGIYLTDDQNLQHSDEHVADQTDGLSPKDLEPILDVQVGASEERERMLALAIFQLSQVPLESMSDLNEWQSVATEKLIRVHSTNKVDSTVNAALATLAYAQGQADIAANLASDLLQQKEALNPARMDAMEILAKWAREREDWKNAAKVYRRLEQVRLDATDAYFLGLCEKQLGKARVAIQQFEKSIRISPLQTGAYLELAALLESEGKLEQATTQIERATKIQRLLQSTGAATPPSPVGISP